MTIINKYDNGIYFKIGFDEVRHYSEDESKTQVKEYNRHLWFSSYLLTRQSREGKFETTLKTIVELLNMSLQRYALNVVKDLLAYFVENKYIELSTLDYEDVCISKLDANSCFIIRTTDKFNERYERKKNYKRITSYEFDKCNCLCKRYDLDTICVWRLYLLIRCSMYSKGVTIEEEFKTSYSHYYTMTTLSKFIHLNIKTVKRYLDVMEEGGLLYTYVPGDNNARLPYAKNFYYLSEQCRNSLSHKWETEADKDLTEHFLNDDEMYEAKPVLVQQTKRKKTLAEYEDEYDDTDDVSGDNAALFSDDNDEI